MPPFIIYGLGMVGAALVGRWIVRETHRVNAELHPAERRANGDGEVRQKLVRDPETGVYRPK